MAYHWLDDLDVALASAGLTFTEVPFSYSDPTGAASWRERGRPASTGSFDVEGVLCHHTASPAGTTAATDISVILAGNGSAPGPISQLFCSRDAQLFLIAAGRANHGGSGVRPGVDDDCTDQNAVSIGIEVGNNGVGERWSDELCVLYARTVAALCEYYGWETGAVYLHATTGPPSGGCNSKIDPAGPWTLEPDLVGSTTWNLDTWRGFVDQHRGGTPEPPPDEGEDDVAPCPILIQASGGDGTCAGAVYVTDGRFCTMRWVADTYQLADIQYWIRAAGLSDAITPVERIGSYGALIGPPATRALADDG